jgi:hypothetical protein
MQHVGYVTENIEKHTPFVDSFVKYTEELTDNGAASDVAQQTRTLHDRADELVKNDVSREVTDFGSVHVSLEAVKLSTKANEGLIGRIKWQHVKGDFLSVCHIALLSSEK